jgi:hypothetical protein
LVEYAAVRTVRDVASIGSVSTPTCHGVAGFGDKITADKSRHVLREIPLIVLLEATNEKEKNAKKRKPRQWWAALHGSLYFGRELTCCNKCSGSG